MGDLCSELDASVEMGSGYICVVGPPSSGKTSAVLDYLVRREERFTEAQPPAQEEGQPTVLVEYWTARGFSRDALAQMGHRLQLHDTDGAPSRRRRRMAYELSPLEFGLVVRAWLSAHAAGSELHLVVDDADALDEESEAVNAWLSNCLEDGRRVYVWLISQLPLRLPNCFRFHFVSAFSVDAVCDWLQSQFATHATLLEREADGEGEATAALDDEKQQSGDSTGSGGDGAPLRCVLSAQAANACVVAAVRYYLTHQPMCASVVCKDVRLLLQRVYQLLPALALMGGTHTAPEAGAPDGVPSFTVSANAIHYSAAWGQRGQQRGDGGGADAMTSTSLSAAAANPLVRALRRIGLSAVLLAFAAFYCGAVPKRRHFEVFGAAKTERGKAKGDTANAQSHKAAVLSAATHIITVPRLLFLYDAMLQMCIEHMDPLEFAAPAVAMHHVHVLQAWGLLTPVISPQSRKKYHCWIPVSTAAQLGKVLSLSLFDLIPT